MQLQTLWKIQSLKVEHYWKMSNAKAQFICSKACSFNKAQKVPKTNPKMIEAAPGNSCYSVSSLMLLEEEHGAFKASPLDLLFFGYNPIKCVRSQTAFISRDFFS